MKKSNIILKINNFIMRIWQSKNLWSNLLLPLSYIFLFIVWLRKNLYKFNILKSNKLSVPVIIVGNITVGGNGKTPLLIYLTNFFKQQGINIGVISRGYGGSYKDNIIVTKETPPSIVGDEPRLIWQKTKARVCVGKDRVAAGNHLITNSNIDLILSDDGLQHYSLARDKEIIVVDNERLFGNRRLLPAGPMRESVNRLNNSDCVIYKNGDDIHKAFKLEIKQFRRISDGKIVELDDIKHRVIHAVTAIANPNSFYFSLRKLGLVFFEHSFVDHWQFTQQDFNFPENELAIVTEKDAVKCSNFNNEQILAAEAELVPNKKLILYCENLLKEVASGKNIT